MALVNILHSIHQYIGYPVNSQSSNSETLGAVIMCHFDHKVTEVAFNQSPQSLVIILYGSEQ